MVKLQFDLGRMYIILEIKYLDTVYFFIKHLTVNYRVSSLKCASDLHLNYTNKHKYGAFYALVLILLTKIFQNNYDENLHH